MISNDLYIGIDSGTQGTKAVLFDKENSEIVAESYFTHEIIENENGRREQEPEWWIIACRNSLQEILSTDGVNPADIKAIGVSGQQHGMVLLDKDGNVIRPAKLWCDTETEQQCITLTGKLLGEETVIRTIGNSIAAGFTASKVLWVKENEPENYQKVSTILLPHDYINFWLTGEKKTEYGDASGTAYFDVKSRTWSDVVLNAIDSTGKIRECLPELIESDQPVGTIRPDLAEEFGLSEGVIVSSGGGDNMMAAIGTGNVAEGIVTASLGTSGTIYTCSSAAVIDPQGELASFCSSTGNWLPLVCTMNVTVSTELTRDFLNLSIEDLNQQIENSSIGAEGILLIPYFNGERTPALPGAKATFTGISSTNFNKVNMCRAAMEGPTFGLKYGMEVLESSGISAKEIRLVGGGAKSAVWRQMVADVFECRVDCPVIEEAGALGAAIQAIWCYENLNGRPTSIKTITDQFVAIDTNKSMAPIKENVERYKEIYSNYKSFGETLYG